MSTSRPEGLRLAPLRLAIEALALAAATVLPPALSGTTLDPHPGWLAVLVLAARYGGVGLSAGLMATVGAVGICALLTGASPLASWSQLESGANLLTLAGVLSVACIGSWHRRCQANLAERVGVLSDRVAGDRALIGALHETCAWLRERLDRASTSLSFLRDVAESLDGLDPVAAAGGAVDLAVSRTGAAAAQVRVGTNGVLRPLATRDARKPGILAPLRMDEAEMTVPIHAQGVRVGILALWGVPASARTKAATHDLEVVASWCSRALTASLRHHVASAGHPRGGK